MLTREPFCFLGPRRGRGALGAARREPWWQVQPAVLGFGGARAAQLSLGLFFGRRVSYGPLASSARCLAWLFYGLSKTEQQNEPAAALWRGLGKAHPPVLPASRGMGERAHKLLALVGLATGKTLANQAKFGQRAKQAALLRNQAIAQRSDTFAAPRSPPRGLKAAEAAAAEIQHHKK